jgi:hypothetical protein
MTATCLQKCVVFFSLGATFAAPVFAQFAYECLPPSGQSYRSKNKCPEGIPWTRVQTDPYYVERRPPPVQSAQAPQQQKQRTIQDALNDLRNHKNMAEYAAARAEIKYFQQLDYAKSGGQGPYVDPDKSYNCTPNGSGGMRCR